MTYYVDLEEYDKGRAIVEDYVCELLSEGASEMASVFSQYVCINVTTCVIIFICCHLAYHIVDSL